MLYGSVVFGSAAVLMWLWRVRGGTGETTAGEDVSRRTLLDSGTLKSVRILVHCLSDTTVTSDTLMTRLVSLYRRFPPDDATIDALARVHKGVQGLGTPDEYCAATVRAAALLSLSEGPTLPPPRLPSPPLQKLWRTLTS